MHNLNPEQIARERALFYYSCALERGDFDTIGDILWQAETDPELERLLLELHEAYLVELAEAEWKQDAAQVRALIAQHIPSALFANPAQPTAMEEPPPLTVADVLARMKTNSDIQPPVRQEASETLQKVQASDVPLPEDISRRGIARLFQQLGLTVSRRLEKLFSDTAILLSMGRQQGLAATRLQRSARSPDQAREARGAYETSPTRQEEDEPKETKDKEDTTP